MICLTIEKISYFLSSGEIDEELSAICTRLWELDANCCYPGDHYDLDLQGLVFQQHRHVQWRAREERYFHINVFFLCSHHLDIILKFCIPGTCGKH